MADKILPALDRFAPGIILVSAGFDAHREDPLSRLELESADFGRLTSLLVRAAEKHCAGKIVSALEGGYDLPALAESVIEHLRAVAGD
jgi:acetoin utilization deacetylase AcuC-like enzyme